MHNLQSNPINKTYTRKDKERASKVGLKKKTIGKTRPRTLETGRVRKLTH